MESWMKELKIPTKLFQISFNENQIHEILDIPIILDSSYKKLAKDDVRQILINSLN